MAQRPSAQLKQKVASFTYNPGAKDSEDKKFLRNINKLTGRRQSSNRQLVAIANPEMFKASQQAMRDPKLGEAEKMKNMGEVMQRGSKLESLFRSSG